MRSRIPFDRLLPVAGPACVAAAVLVSAPVSAQQPHDHATSPYADFGAREIKALSEVDVQALLDGEGMQMALPAELNGYPGPRHVLELADSLALSPEQRASTERIMAGMLSEARALGARIVEAERDLDRSFADATITDAALRSALDDLASLRADLRAAHLSAHLAMKEVLTLHQVHRYDELRGYGSGHGHGGS